MIRQLWWIAVYPCAIFFAVLTGAGAGIVVNVRHTHRMWVGEYRKLQREAWQRRKPDDPGA